MGSALTYCANCLTSAPYKRARAPAGAGAGPVASTLLLASQYGIFLGFLVGPLAMRGAMMLTATNQNVLAAVLVVGWALQAALNARASWCSRGGTARASRDKKFVQLAARADARSITRRAGGPGGRALGGHGEADAWRAGVACERGPKKGVVLRGGGGGL